MEKINFQRIHYFLTVAELLNFTEAAKKLYITQPALSKQITAFEKEVGFQLFKRTTKQVILTEPGKSFYQQCQKIYQDMEEAIASGKKVSENCIYKVRIGLLEMGGIIDYVMPRLDSFSENLQGVQIEYVTFGFRQLKDKIRDNELDIIFTLNSEIPRDCYEITTKKITDLKLCIVVPKRNRFYNHQELRVSDLEDEVICTFSDAYSDEARRSIVKHCQKEGFYPTKLKVYPNIQSMMIGMNIHGDLSIGYKAFFKEIESLVRFFPIDNEMGPHSIVMGYREQANEEILDIVQRILDHKKNT